MGAKISVESDRQFLICFPDYQENCIKHIEAVQFFLNVDRSGSPSTMIRIHNTFDMGGGQVTFEDCSFNNDTFDKVSNKA